ncbi:alpha/beta fold hydrolase [Pseudonocardia alaniniphila]|uniref:Alpha/beta hydrolase family protein n=1 Tax=Pseudonocardia alaniniphila TaxID=75291 RepID=A0ABS9TUR0_9PSEU|nr:hypothetical protein [Pseudonocardia alaniniphila]MCH6171966.1 hypothetical protein [Pseudonocardia alaniniphila]
MTTSRTVDGPAGPLNVTIYGDPVLDGTVVLMHPINSAAMVWEHVSAVPRRPTAALDLRGHGGSTLQGPFTVEGSHVDDALDVLGLGWVHEVAALHSERLPMLGVPVRVGALIDEHIAGVGAGAGR